MDTGKLAIGGFGAGAIKYTLLDGFVPNPGGGGTVNANLITMGYGTATAHKLVLDGFKANPGSGGGGEGTGGGLIFEGALTGMASLDGWL